MHHVTGKLNQNVLLSHHFWWDEFSTTAFYSMHYGIVRKILSIHEKDYSAERIWEFSINYFPKKNFVVFLSSVSVGKLFHKTFIACIQSVKKFSHVKNSKRRHFSVDSSWFHQLGLDFNASNFLWSTSNPFNFQSLKKFRSLNRHSIYMCIISV